MIVAVLFGLFGVWDLFYGAVFTYIFSSAHMLSPGKIAWLLIIFGDCLIYFFLAARLSRQRWFVSVILLVLVWLILPIALRVLINTTTMRVRNDGYSMTSALPNGVYVLADREAYLRQPPQRGDIVILRDPSSPNSQNLLVKRIIGLPGETVKIVQGQVLINGAPLDEPYLSSAMPYRGEWKLPEGQYFVLGDNRADSKDSHQWGSLPYENIVAKAVWVYWPFANFGKIPALNFAQ
jgi:signal peptidase I